MSSRRFVVRESRNVRVIFGGVLVIPALLLGMVLSLLWQRDMTMLPYPDEITVPEFLERGWEGNSFVRLTDVKLGSKAEDVRLFDGVPAVSIEPASGLTGTERHRLVMRLTDKNQSVAPEMIGRDGALTGRIHVDAEFHSAVKLLKWLGVDASVRPELDHVTSREEYPFVIDPQTSGFSLPGQDQETVRYIFYGCLAVGILGLLIAGSGGPSIWPWFLFPGPAAMSLPGYFLRYGRGNAVSRSLYLVVGAAMLAGGYYCTFFEGRIFRPDFDSVLMPGVFLLACFGGSAVSGAVLNQMWGGLHHTQSESQGHLSSMVAVPGSQVAQQIRLGAAASGDSLLSESIPDLTVRRYQDPPIGIAAEPLVPAKMREITDRFEQIDFEAPLIIDVGSDDEMEKQTIQVGCRNMVMVVTHLAGDPKSGKAHSRLFGVLDSGQVVTTLSAGTPSSGKTRTGSSGVVWVSSQADPAALLAEHIEKMVAVAQASGTNITELQRGEWRDLYAYAHRVMIDIGHQHGDNGYKVYPSTHGRFQFPFQPIEPLTEFSQA